MRIVRLLRLEKVLDITDETCPYSTLFLKSVPFNWKYILLKNQKSYKLPEIRTTSFPSQTFTLKFLPYRIKFIINLERYRPKTNFKGIYSFLRTANIINGGIAKISIKRVKGRIMGRGIGIRFPFIWMVKKNAGMIYYLTSMLTFTLVFPSRTLTSSN